MSVVGKLPSLPPFLPVFPNLSQVPVRNKRACANNGPPGVDFGALNTVIAVARNRGVDVVRTLLDLDLSLSIVLQLFA